MGRVTIVFLFTFFLSFPVISQQGNEFTGKDKTTYDLYLDGSWKELIRFGEEAIREGADYYYLRMRLGIAAYELKDYSRAIRHFSKALEFNSSDNNALEYLYFSYLFYGREMEANEVARKFPPSLKEKISYGTGEGVRSFSLNGTRSFLHNREITAEYPPDTDLSVDDFRYLTLSFTSLNAALVHSAGNSMTITHALGYLSKDYMLQWQPPAGVITTDERGLSQLQYYISGRILSGIKTYIIPAIHYVNVQVPVYTTVAGPGRRTFLSEQYDLYHDFAASIGIERYFGKMRPGISAGYSDINDQQQVQGSFSLTWFPLGNLDLYTFSDITWYTVIPANGRDGGPVFSQELGFRAFPGLWIELWGSIGEVGNFAASRAYLIYNDSGVVREQYGVRLIAPFIGKNIELSVFYSYNLQEDKWYSLRSDGYSPDPFETKNHKITGGIKWKF